jgi:hypothetical protein
MTQADDGAEAGRSFASAINGETVAIRLVMIQLVQLVRDTEL